jgi:hypothetical protein
VTARVLLTAFLTLPAAFLTGPFAPAEALGQAANGGEAQAEVPETTEVGGEIPRELLGRWVAFAHVKMPAGQQRHFTRLWEVGRGSEHYELTLHRVSLPKELLRDMEAANASGEAWQTGPDDVRGLSEQWDRLSKSAGDYVKIENKLLAADAYPPEFEQDVITKGSDYAFVFNEVFTGRQSVTRTYSIYAVRERELERLSGSFITTTMANAPFPIPITLKGDFEAYRAGAPPPPPSWFERLLGAFSGCAGR